MAGSPQDAEVREGRADSTQPCLRGPFSQKSEPWGGERAPCPWCSLAFRAWLALLKAHQEPPQLPQPRQQFGEPTPLLLHSHFSLVTQSFSSGQTGQGEGKGGLSSSSAMLENAE